MVLLVGMRETDFSFPKAFRPGLVPTHSPSSVDGKHEWSYTFVLSYASKPSTAHVQIQLTLQICSLLWD